MLKQFISDRNNSIYAQLASTQSTTNYGNISTSITLSDMGERDETAVAAAGRARVSSIK